MERLYAKKNVFGWIDQIENQKLQKAVAQLSSKREARANVSSLKFFLKFGDPQRVIFSHRKTSDCFNPCYSDEAKGYDFSIGNRELTLQSVEKRGYTLNVQY